MLRYLIALFLLTALPSFGEGFDSHLMLFATGQSGPSMVYGGSDFNEAPSNDGAITDTLSITLYNETLVTTGALTATTHYTITNVPTGLTAVVTADTTTEITVSFTGTATTHTSAQDENDIVLTFLDAAFTGGDASAVTNSANTYTVSFTDEGILTWDVATLNETVANTGLVTETVTVTVANDTWTDLDAMVLSTDYTVTGTVPSGMTLAIQASSSTSATITLSGTAAAHANANDVVLTIEFLDAAFTGLAPNAGSESQATTIDFRDAISIAYSAVQFDEAVANDGTVDTAITATLTGDTWRASSGTLTGGGSDYTLSGNSVSAGLTWVATFTSSTVVTFTMTGTATAHADANDVSGIINTFTTAARTSAYAIVGGTDAETFNIDFDDASYTNVGSLNLGGTDEYLDCGDITEVDTEYNQPISVTFWTKLASTPGTSMYVITNATESGDIKGWQTAVNGTSGFLNWQLIQDNDSPLLHGRLFGQADLGDNAWHCIGVVYDGDEATGGAGGSMALYVDSGTAVAETVNADTMDTSTTMIGTANVKIGGKGSLFFTGFLDEVAIWPVELSSSDMGEICGGTAAVDLSSVSAAANLEAWWRFDASDAHTGAGAIKDHSGNAHHCTPNNLEDGDENNADVPS